MLSLCLFTSKNAFRSDLEYEGINQKLEALQKFPNTLLFNRKGLSLTVFYVVRIEEKPDWFVDLLDLNDETKQDMTN